MIRITTKRSVGGYHRLSVSYVTDKKLGKMLALLVRAKPGNVFSTSPFATENQGAIMTSSSDHSLTEICTRVKHLGYAPSKRVRIYGEEFEVVSDPFPHGGGIAVYVKSKKESRVRPLPLPKMLLLAVREQRFVRAA